MKPADTSIDMKKCDGLGNCDLPEIFVVTTSHDPFGEPITSRDPFGEPITSRHPFRETTTSRDPFREPISDSGFVVELLYLTKELKFIFVCPASDISAQPVKC